MASKICQSFLKSPRNSRFFSFSEARLRIIASKKFSLIHCNPCDQFLNHSKLYSRRFSSLVNIPIRCTFLVPGACGRSDSRSPSFGQNLKYRVQRYCTNTGYEEFQDKVKQIMSKSPTGTKEKLDEQLAVLQMLCRHKQGAATSADVTEAAKNVHPDTLYELALVVYTIHEQVGENTIEFWAPLFRLASLAGSEDAKYTYAQMLTSGTGIDPDPLEAARLFRDLADGGHSYAQFALASMYYHGIGIEKDFETAFDLYEKSSKNGVDMALSMMGNMYLKGQAVEQNYKLALQYFQMGVKKGDATAELSLAHCYSHGKGVTEDLAKAFEYHASAAEKGHPVALYNTGTHYFAGKGVELSMEKAAEYFEKAANLGFELAQINLGNMYYNGLGVEKDWKRAKELYQQAAPTNANAAALLKEIEGEERKLMENKPDE